METKNWILTGVGVSLALSALSGCSHTITGADGSKVTFDQGGAKIQATDAKGNTSTLQTNDQGGVTMKSKDGELTTTRDTMVEHDNKGNSIEQGLGFSDTEMGVPFYPGSTDTKGSAKVTANGATTFSSIRETKDSFDKVVAFYGDKLGKPETKLSSDQMAMSAWKKGDQSVTLMVKKDDDTSKADTNDVIVTVVNKK